jgi:uncharacterized RDD family membrane protein YckC
MFQVIDRAGQTHGPVSIDVLRQWVAENRLTPDMTLVDPATGQSGPAGTTFAHLGLFPPAPAGGPAPVAQFPGANPQFGFQGSEESGKMPKFGLRFVGFFIDLVIGTGTIGLFETWKAFLFSAFNVSWMNYANYALGTLAALFFITRDSWFKGQSIGKRIAKSKVVDSMGQKATMLQSAMRNAPFAFLIFVTIPYVGPYFAVWVFLIAMVADLFLVLTTGKRLGDSLARTSVVNE